MAIIELKRENFDTTVQGSELVIVDFWALWCAPCKSFAPIFEKASENFSQVVFAKVDAESESDLASHFHIRSIPTLLIFRNQIIIFRLDQSLAEDELFMLVDKAGSLDMNQIRKDALESN